MRSKVVKQKMVDYEYHRCVQQANNASHLLQLMDGHDLIEYEKQRAECTRFSGTVDYQNQLRKAAGERVWIVDRTGLYSEQELNSPTELICASNVPSVPVPVLAKPAKAHRKRSKLTHATMKLADLRDLRGAVVEDVDTYANDASSENSDKGLLPILTPLLLKSYSVQAPGVNRETQMTLARSITAFQCDCGNSVSLTKEGRLRQHNKKNEGERCPMSMQKVTLRQIYIQ